MNVSQSHTPRPLLSICIPTYNRAEWLRLSLAAWLPQVAATNGAVELIVSDNCSPDHTNVVAMEALQVGDFRYHRNPENIGANPNFYLLVNELARGEYVWVVGDDDLVRPGAVSKIIAVLEAHPHVDYVNVNYIGWHPSGPQDVQRLETDSVSISDVANPRHLDCYLAELGEIVGEDSNCFTPVYGSIFRRLVAQVAFQGSIYDEAFTTLNSVVSHAVYIAENMLRKPAYYIGCPCILVAFNGWPKYEAVYLLKLMPELYDIFGKDRGCRKRLDSHRRNLFGGCRGHLLKALTNPDEFTRANFSLREWIWRNRRFGTMWQVLVKVLVKVLALRVLRFLPTGAQSRVKAFFQRRRMTAT